MNFTATTDSIEINKNFKQTFTNLLNISIANYGANPIVLNVSGVKRTLPPGNLALDVPQYTFGYSCEGIPFDIEIELLFPNGASRVLIDKSTLKNC